MVRPVDGKLHLENVGLNSCVVGDEEVLGGQSAVFEPGAKVRIWPYTLSFETERAAPVSRTELETHLRSIVAELELRIHGNLWSGSTFTSLKPIAAAMPRASPLGEQYRRCLPRHGRFRRGERSPVGGNHRAHSATTW